MAAMNGPSSGRSLLWSLVEALQWMPCLAELAGRNLVVRLLIDELGPLPIEESSIQRRHLVSIVEVCQRQLNGLATLLAILELIEPDVKYLPDVRRIILEMANETNGHDTPRGQSGRITGRIFISYRREDARHVAGRICDRLIDRLGEDQVFMDVDSIELGMDFRVVIGNAVGQCEILLAVIGAGWATMRLGDPDDIVRLELEAALKRNIRVIPLLVDGVEMPQLEDLPSSLAALTRRHGLKIRHDSFRHDIGRLLDAIGRTL